MAKCNKMPHFFPLCSFLVGIIASTSAVEVPVDCQPDWTNIGVHCYRLFRDVLPWQSADRVCQSYGSQLVKVKDFYENDRVGQFVQAFRTSEYWIGVSRLGTQQTDERALLWSDGTEATVAVGYWNNAQPDVDLGQCVLAKVDNGQVLWSFSPCERKAPYVCQRPAAPQGSFHCHNGHFVRQGLTCDGEDDCGDGSDELNCNSRCSYYIRNQQSGTISSPNSPNVYPNKKMCTWLIELELGYNVQLKFTEFVTEKNSDEVLVLAGGMTVSTSRLVARLSGDLSASLSTYTSSNNLMMVIFNTDATMSNRGFRATFSAVKDEAFPPRKFLTATDTAQELISPFYPECLGSQDYTWIITAQEKVRIITLKPTEVDLKGEDRVLIRDGDMVFHNLLAEMTSTSGATPRYVLSTGRHLYITMQTRGLETGRGFRFSYWQGCKVSLNGTSGNIHSPGYRPTGGQYGAYQRCTYDVTVPGGVPVTVRFDSMKVHESDEIVVNEGTQQLYNSTTSRQIPDPFIVNSGSFNVIFDSDAIQTDEGFSLTYSVACATPQFNDKTVLVPRVMEFPLGTRVKVSCVRGYAFSAMEFQDTNVMDGFEPLREVTLECLAGGTWNVKTLPLCEPRYCDQPPAVTNANVVQSTGVTFSATARYQCNPGFAMQGGDTILCTDTGGWTTTPTCQTAACTPLGAAIPNGNLAIRSGDNSNFSSIVEYLCYPGYQVIGDPILFCGSDGSWSAGEPRCEVLQCYVPRIRNGYLERSGEMIDVGVSVMANCNDGYISSVPGGGPNRVTCLSDRTLQGLDGFTCSYQDKCEADPNYCEQLCHDSEFENRTCSCNGGYTLGTDLRSCQNIDECVNNSAGCDHLCTDTPGGYRCSCSPGYVLFSFDGIQGYNLAPNEDGLRPGDVRRLNHTCLPVLCPNPPMVSNGNKMVDLDAYHYGDYMEYTCNLGYELSGVALLTCNESGLWDNNAPQCNPAVCLPDTIPPSVRNAAVVTPVGQVRLGETVTLTCNVPGKPSFTKSRYCVYYEGQYQLVGADYECGLIDCGLPVQVSGSMYGNLDTSNTTYGASFQFGCQNLYGVHGSSEAGDSVVRCLQDGRWDFGSLRCEGLICTDPGRPPDGRQVNSLSYDQDDLVHFECDKEGFVLSDPFPLKCQLNAAGNGLEWNATVPQCIDTQSPTLTGCSDQPVPVTRYARANTVLSVPSAADNVYVYKYRVTDAVGGAIWPSDDLVLSRMTIFFINVTDHAGNTAGCVTVASISDDIPPTIQCPLNEVREFTAENQQINVPLPASLVSVTDNIDTKPPMLTPSDVSFTVSAAQLTSTFPPFRSYDVTATVEDTSGNTGSCQFELHFRPEACSPFSLRTPLHGQKNCTALTANAGFRCELFCDDGFVFHDQPASSSISHTCYRGDSWNVPDIPGCVHANKTTPDEQARFRQTFRFTYTKGEGGMCTDVNTYRDLLTKELDTSEGYLPGLCGVQIPSDRITGQLSVSDISETQTQVLVNITLAYDIRENKIYEQCKGLIQYNFEQNNFQVTAPFRQSFSPLGCPTISTSNGAVLVDEEYFCTTGKKIKFQPEGYTSPIDVCVACPEGTRTVGSTCELCPIGTFNSVPGSLSCSGCATDTSTFRTGAVSNGECTALCKAGTYSPTGLPPCSMCPLNTYSVNSTYCSPCPTDYVTRGTGSTALSQCLPPCPASTYNPIDGHGDPDLTGSLTCSKCPANFYANTTATTMCTECSGNQKTVGEGSTSLADCIEHTGCNASNNPCQNSGQCNIVNHAVFCTCLDGYNGRYCEQRVDPCSSSPCYFGAQCSSNGGTFTCNCPAGTGGQRCETLVGTCTPDYCLNGGACRNDLNTATCLCRPGFSGDSGGEPERCQTTQPICEPNPCQNGGQCVSLENVRYRCDCATGYDGQQCQNNIDDCASNPCLHGGNCTDLVNNFQCSCPDGFSGPRCENRQMLCDTASCNQGKCVEDHADNTYRCVCPEGNFYGTVCQYEAYFGFDLNGSAAWEYEASGVSIADCMAKCEAVGCLEILYDNSSFTCRVADKRQRISVQLGSSVYYYRQCTRVTETYFTPWYDSFIPGNDSDSGDDELLVTFKQYGLDICGGTEAVAAECEVVGSGGPPSDYLAVNCSPAQGLLCLNKDQQDGQCENYEIRFKCLSSRVLSKSPCEDINYCNSSGVCENGGTCNELPTEASCNCALGYTGSRCQHDFDNCASDPCQNGATCVDQFNSYRCDCMPGYGGSRCETDINECFPSPCSAQGTLRCNDLVNRYECVCKPGYTGVRCESDINECDSQPCLHGGQCVNGVNKFTCNCADGWSGSICQNKTELCSTTTCKNGATCSNLFNDFYCSCLPNTYGKDCSNASSICTNANPCLHGSTCSESQGHAMCDCSPEYVGNGCEIRRDLCSDTNPVCKNGASCSASLGNFSCDCPDGYRGQFCEENIDDCQFNTCPSGSTCIDMVNEYFCRCPVGKSGEDCLKDTDRQFDLLFLKPQKSSMAALGYPLHLTGNGFSITMWIQYLNKGDTGTFFTLYQVSDPNSLSNKRELLRLDEMGLTLALDQQPRQLNTTVDYNQDGEWHYIVLSWNQANGLFSFFVDTIRIPITGYNRGQPLDFNVWMVLGCRYDVGAEMCREGEGFNGYISQVSLYNRELIFKDELTVLGNTDPFYVFPDARMTWGEFFVYPGVTRVYPSKADKSCPRGFTDFPRCTTPVAGKTTVSIDRDSCPKDIVKYSANRVTQVTWPAINFKGQVNQVKSSQTSGTVFLWGKYPVVVEASNMDGNKALCAFDIYVQYDQCKTPATPMNAAQVFCADFTDDKDRDYRQCSVSCFPDYEVVVPSPQIHTCGPVGSWDPPNRYIPYTLPPCGATSIPKRRLIVVIVYHVLSTECSEVSQEIREQMELRLQQQNSLWSNGLCRLTNCMDIQLDIQCDLVTTPTGRRKRQAPASDITVTITIDDVPATLTSTADSSLKRSPEDLLQQLVLSDSVFDFSSRIAAAEPDPNGLDVQVQLLCQAPMALSGTQCVTCAAGSYYDASTETCALCSIGTYQSLSAQSSCVPCTPGTTTETVGSFNSNQCKRVCATGQYYNHDTDDCALCPQGFYQNTTGLFHCVPCPVDTTTRQPGATSEAVCYNDCPPGEELAENGTCTACVIGFYKPSSETLCGPCPPGLVTNATGADSEDDCNVADNQPGYYRTRPDETQSLPCPIGTYQPQKWQYDCESCGGDRYRTDTMAATSQSDCKFFCPAGQEQDCQNSVCQELCRPCDIGFYRTGDNPYSSCDLCPNNTRTTTTGSTSVNDCTIYKCSAGYRPTADQENCEKCPRGTYQPQPDQTDCLPCMGAKMDTRTDGAVLESECERYCDSGYQKMDNGTCIICPIGFYKDNSIDNFHECTRCADPRFVTPSAGSTSQAQCTVLDCPAGQKINGNVCDECPQGTYQDQPYQTQCIGCPANQSTRRTASTSSTDCETFCVPGEEKIGDQCVVCERGYYKNNHVNVFMDCTLCPPEYVTPTIRSTSQAECTVRNCTEGQYISGDNCSLCPFGLYQPDRWQTSCVQCPTDRTTQRNGAVNISECILSCPPGKENKPGSNICTECQQGFYKNIEAAALCDPCPVGFVTRINGSTSRDDCELRACEAGSYASGVSAGGCTSCPFGEYQPDKWQEQCIPCLAGFTTYQRGAASKDLCLRDCLPGQEYSSTTQTCEQCPIGYYNDDLDPARYTCIMCNADYITASEGAKSDRDCNIRNCTVPGQYRDAGENVCRDCPRGQWQNQKWQTSCSSCNVGLTTRYTGTSNPADCLYDCPSGQQLAQSGDCTDCPVGRYRDKTDSWECQQCPDGLTTRNTGAASRQECSISTCGVGKYFNNDTQVQKCQQCPQDSYQDLAGQFTCKRCPSRTETRMPGATQASDCVDKCLTNSNNCDLNARCASTVDGVTCVCNDGYSGDGNTCTHMCDVDGYCQNSIRCDRERLACICEENYEGVRCEQRVDPKAAGLGEKDTIIVAVVTTLAFLLFLVLLVVCCCVWARKRQRNKVPFPHETSDERASIATRMSTRGFDDFGGGYATKPPSFAAGPTPRLMLPAQNQQMYENPTYTMTDDPAVYKV